MLAYLSHEGHTTNANQTSTITMGVPKVSIIPPAVILGLGRDLCNHLLHLKLDNGMVWRAFTMKLSEDTGGFFMSVFSDEPAWLWMLSVGLLDWRIWNPGTLETIGRIKTYGFWEEIDESCYYSRCDELDPDRQPPAVVTVHEGASIDNPSCNDSSNRPIYCQVRKLIS